MCKQRRPFTEGYVIKPSLIIAAEELHNEKAVKRVKELPLSNDTMLRQTIELNLDLQDKLFQKLRDMCWFGLQLDESTDVSSRAQLLAYVRYSDLDAETIREEYICCLDVGVCTTCEAIFLKLDEFIEENRIPWEKCSGITADGAAAMTGKISGVITRIRTIAPHCISKHCIIHSEPLAVKRFKT